MQALLAVALKSSASSKYGLAAFGHQRQLEDARDRTLSHYAHHGVVFCVKCHAYPQYCFTKPRHSVGTSQNHRHDIAPRYARLYEQVNHFCFTRPIQSRRWIYNFAKSQSKQKLQLECFCCGLSTCRIGTPGSTSVCFSRPPRFPAKRTPRPSQALAKGPEQLPELS